MRKDYDKAIADLDRAIELDPDCAKAFLNRGDAFEGQGDHASRRY